MLWQQTQLGVGDCLCLSVPCACLPPCAQSDLVKVFVGPGSPPHEVSRITAVGTKAHGVVAWGSDLVMLDSDNGALVSLDTEGGDVYDLYMVRRLSAAPVEDCTVLLSSLCMHSGVAQMGA